MEEDILLGLTGFLGKLADWRRCEALFLARWDFTSEAGNVWIYELYAFSRTRQAPQG